MPNYISVQNCTGTAQLSMGTDTTHSIKATLNFKNIAIERPVAGKANFTLDFESDGPVDTTGLTDTNATDIAGFGGLCSIGNVTANFSAWTARVVVDTEVYQTFASRWKSSKVTGAQLTGSASGVVRVSGVVTTTTATAG